MLYNSLLWLIPTWSPSEHGYWATFNMAFWKYSGNRSSKNDISCRIWKFVLDMKYHAFAQQERRNNCSWSCYVRSGHKSRTYLQILYEAVFLDSVLIYIQLDATFLFFHWRCDPTRVMASSFLRFLDHAQRRTAVGRTPLDEWSARRRDLCLTTHNTHNRQTSMPPVGFEPTISVGERPQIYALDVAATGTGD